MAVLRAMLASLLLLCAASSCGAVTAVAAGAVTPAQKVIDLLKELKTKLQKEGEEETAQYKKFSAFCVKEAGDKKFEIERSGKKISQLSAQIGKLKSDISDLGDGINKLSTGIADNEKTLKEATETRAKERAEYEKKAKDMVDSIEAVNVAIKSLEGTRGQLQGAKIHLAQVKAIAGPVLDAFTRSAVLPASDSELRTLTALVQLDRADPASYQYSSNSIIATFKSMLNLFQNNKLTLDKEESTTQAAFNKKELGLNNQKKFQNQEKAEKQKAADAKAKDLAAAETSKGEEEKDKAADESYLEELQKDCKAKDDLSKQRTKSRADELVAIGKAVETLSAKLGGASKSQLQTGESVDIEDVGAEDEAPAQSFLQLRSRRSKEQSQSESSQATVEVTQFLSSAAKEIGSQLLSVAAIRASVAGPDHFAKVRQLIKDLIARLETQKEADSNKKAFCDKGIAESTAGRDAAQAKIESLSAQSEKLQAEKGRLTTEIADLKKGIAELEKALAEATALRTSESAENAKNLKVAKEGKEAVDLALQVLSEYYKKAAGSSFAETESEAAPAGTGRDGKTINDKKPEVFTKAYSGAQGESKGIIGLLEVMAEDFLKQSEKTTAQETAAATAFAEFKGKTETTVKEKKAGVKERETRISEIENELVLTSGQIKEQQKLLTAAQKALKDLEAQCVTSQETAEEREAKRRKEIEALKDAARIFEDIK